MAHAGIQIDQRSTPEQIANGLRDMILRGDLLPGDPVRESLIASDLRVSRNTVREAVRLLERTGLITYEMNRGARVRNPSREEVVDLFAARLAIEAGATMIGSITEAEEPLRRAFDKLDSALERGASEEALQADLNFHVTIVAMGNSSRLNSAYRRILNEFRLHLVILSKAVGEYGKAEQIRKDHLGILEAFNSGEVDRAVEALRVHTTQSRTACLEALNLSNLIDEVDLTGGS